MKSYAACKLGKIVRSLCLATMLLGSIPQAIAKMANFKGFLHFRFYINTRFCLNSSTAKSLLKLKTVFKAYFSYDI